jgi:hypothetical protein
MRLRREQAILLAAELNQSVLRSVHLRADARDRGDLVGVAAYNQRLSDLRAMAVELARLIEEMRW